MPDGLLHMERTLFRRMPLELGQLQALYWGTPIVFSEADLADGLQTGDVVRMTFEGDRHPGERDRAPGGDRSVAALEGG